MGILQRLLAFLAPHERRSGVLELHADQLRAMGIDALLLDVDCTLKDHGCPDVPAAVVAWLERLRAEGFPIGLVSNGKARRIGPLASALGLPFVAMAKKPLPFACRQAARTLGVEPSRVAIVGDQLFTDVLAGRLAGFRTILVTPTSQDAPWMTRVKRPFERWVLARLPGDSPCARPESPPPS
ncbi:MAG: YqeG family HAD IIIA-type phosphatase [Isosphaeraceae bacterium]